MPEATSDEFGGRPFSQEERRALHRLAEREKELEEIVEAFKAKRFLWKILLNLAGLLAALGGGIVAFQQFFKGGSG